MSGAATGLSDSPAARGGAILVLLAIAGIGVWLARHLFLDDAFIHLRIAGSLLERGFYSFNGDFATYCTSSPLFTALLAAGRAAWRSDFLPKVVSLLGYAALLLLLARESWRAAGTRVALLWVVFLAAVASPLGVRWLTDGMETSLVAVAAVLLAGLAARIARRDPVSAAGVAAAVAFGAIVATLRVEFCFLIAITGLASLTSWRQGLSAAAVGLGVGAALGLGVLLAVFGTVLPDTAVAKASGGFPTVAAIVASLIVIAKAHAAASLLGVGLLVSWAVSAAWAARSPHRAFALALNTALPIFIVLVLLRGQAIQGYRYFVFVEFFLLAFNLHILRASLPMPEVTAGARRASATAVAAVLSAMGLWFAHDFYRLYVMTAGRAETFAKFRATRMADLAGSEGIAWDVGFVGYFSDATILDANGLVNGPAVARLSKSERLRSFAARTELRFVFANDAQLRDLSPVLDTADWVRRESFDFPNFSGLPDRHHLLVRPR